MFTAVQTDKMRKKSSHFRTSSSLNMAVRGGLTRFARPAGSPLTAFVVCPTGCASCRTPVGASHPPWSALCGKKLALSYELFFKYGGEGGIDSLRSPCGQPTHCVRGLSNWLRQLSNPGRGFSPPWSALCEKKLALSYELFFKYGVRRRGHQRRPAPLQALRRRPLHPHPPPRRAGRRALRHAEPPVLHPLQHRRPRQPPRGRQGRQPPARHRLGVVELRLRPQQGEPLLRAPPHRPAREPLRRHEEGRRGDRPHVQPHLRAVPHRAEILHRVRTLGPTGHGFGQTLAARALEAFP
uniref:UDP-glucuronic acid 4-epimerase n=1 Tax=Boehmeria nivea TaxID=83906 RepID=A8D2K3_BOENI|nr:UDP-glucuronic acid 4-epimerase [Boehmeria nivea]